MGRTVHAAAVQFNISLGAVETNLAKAETALGRLGECGIQLAVLPEMWSTGYDYKRLPELAPETPRVIETLCTLTEKYRMVTVGSLPELEGGRIFNTAYVIDQGRVVGSYRKL